MTQPRGTRTLIAYILASALRDRLFLALLVLVTLAAALAVFIGDTAIVDRASTIDDRGSSTKSTETSGRSS